MDGFETYKTYIALKTHFNSSNYDYKKYNGKTGTKLESFIKRSDRFYFGRVHSKYKDEVENYFIANFLEDPKGWVGKFNEDNYLDWKRRNQSLSYMVNQDIKSLCDKSPTFDGLFESQSGQHPIIIKEYISRRLSHETVSILDSILGFTNRLEGVISDSIVYPKYKNIIQKYKSLLNVDVSKQKLNIFKTVQDYYS